MTPILGAQPRSTASGNTGSRKVRNVGFNSSPGDADAGLMPTPSTGGPGTGESKPVRFPPGEDAAWYQHREELGRELFLRAPRVVLMVNET